MGRDGWELLPPDPTADDLIASCVPLKDEVLGESIERALTRLGSDPSADRPHRSATEIAKSSARGVFRTHPMTRDLAIRSAMRLERLFGQGSTGFYAAPPYAYIHLEQDELAANEMHRDDYDEVASRFFVSWTPLNDCMHQPMEIVSGTHRRMPMHRLRWALHLRGLPTWLLRRPTVMPDPNLGESLAWTARTYHSGTLNRSGAPHVALNTKIRDIPIPFEPCHLLGTAAPSAPVSSAGEHTDALIDLTEELETLSQAGAAAPWTQLLSEVSRVVEAVSPDPHERARLSFSLTIAGMRMPDVDPAAATWHMASSLLSPEYLWSFQRLIRAADQHRPDDTERLSRTILDRHPFHQVAEVITSTSTRVRLPSNRLPVVGWA